MESINMRQVLLVKEGNQVYKQHIAELFFYFQLSRLK